jgi:tetratricopeptide (TPR) repeat protein
MSTHLKEIEAWLAEGLRLHQSEQLAAAQVFYRKILEKDNQHADALFLLGTSYLQLNDPYQSINFIQQALEIRPNSAAIHINLANAFQALGKKSMAVTHFEKAIEFEPNNADAHFNLAINLESQSPYKEATYHYEKTIMIKQDHIGAINNLGIIFQRYRNHDKAIKCFKEIIKLQESNVEANYNIANSLQANHQNKEAIQHYKTSIKHNPQHWMAYLNLGQCLEKHHSNVDAIEAYKQVILLNPDYAETYYFLGRVLQLEKQETAAVEYYQLALDRGVTNKLIYYYAGLALAKLENYEGAIAAYQQAIVLDDKNEKIYLHLGDALQQLQHYTQAILQYEKALSLNSQDEEVLNNLGCAFGAVNRYDEAMMLFHKAINIKPNYIEAFNNLGCTLMELNELDEAIAQFDSAISLKPDYKDAFWNKGLAYLCQGKFEQGLPLYEHRPTAVHNQPLNTYEEFINKSQLPRKLFIESEQGFGDIIQTLRYVNLVIAKGIECWIKIPIILNSLVQRSFPLAHIISDDTIPHDVINHIALMSLPLVMRTFSEKTIPNNIPYLVPDSVKTEHWKTKLVTNSKKRVGIFWRGQNKARNDNRSLKLDEIKPLFENQHIQFIVIQKDVTTPEFIELKNYKNITMLDHELIDFDETAAVMANLDLMISIDSAPVHLAGALGLKTLALLPFAVDWRWMMERTDSPWYPNTALFRQKKPGEWESVINEVKAALNNLTK